MDSVYSENITPHFGINDRASTYLPYEMDVEWVPWDCDNVSVDTDWEEEDDQYYTLDKCQKTLDGSKKDCYNVKR